MKEQLLYINGCCIGSFARKWQDRERMGWCFLMDNGSIEIFVPFQNIKFFSSVGNNYINTL